MIDEIRGRRVFAWKPTNVNGTEVWLEHYFVEETYGPHKVFFDPTHPHRFHLVIGWHEIRRWFDQQESCGKCEHCDCH